MERCAMRVAITPFRAEEVREVPMNWGCLEHIMEKIGPFDPPRVLADLRAAFPSVEFAAREPGISVEAVVRDADVVLGWLPPEGFAAARRLRWIQTFSSGVDWILPIPELVASDVALTNMRGTSGATIAEHAFAQLLFLTRSLRHFDAEQRARRWGDILGVPLGSLRGLTMGIVGLGSIGSAITECARAFGMEVVALIHEREPDPSLGVARMWRRDGLADFLRAADVVAVTPPLTPETRGLIGAGELALLRPSAYVLILSRGGIVDEGALVAMLHTGRLAGAAMDVATQEPPPPESPLWDAPNLLITPHCSGYSRQTSEAILRVFTDNLARFLAGEPLVNIVDKRTGK